MDKYFIFARLNVAHKTEFMLWGNADGYDNLEDLAGDLRILLKAGNFQFKIAQMQEVFSKKVSQILKLI